MLVHGDIFDDGYPATVHQRDFTVKEAANDELFGAALFKAAQINQASADDLRLIHGGEPCHRHEDALLSGHLHHDAHRMGCSIEPAAQNNYIA